MADRFSESMKNIFLAGVGAIAVTAEKSKDLIEDLVKKGELTVEQGKILNEELKHSIKDKYNQAKEKYADEKRKFVVEEFMKNIDTMSQEEIVELKAKLSDLNSETDSEIIIEVDSEMDQDE